jgi:3-hydroxyisobutyrate dehydrogenase
MMAESGTPRIAFIGTGGMGQGMARCLLAAGYDLVVCNRTAARAQPLVDAGAELALTPCQAAAGADVFISMVGDDGDSRAVWLGADGVLAGQPNENAIAIESSTLSPGWVRELAEVLKTGGLAYIDSPVTGGRGGAEQGTLTLLVGAEESDLARAWLVMDAYSQRIVHFGPVGAGTAYKLVVNLMVGVQAVALAEGLLLAERSGLDMDQVIGALTSGAVASPVVKAYAQKMAGGDHDEVANFLARWMHKDMTYGVRLAFEVEQPVPTSAVATQVYQTLLARGLADKNVTAVIEALR